MQVNKPLKVHILGTDTDVGKTWICEKLIHSLNSKGYPALPVKPVHSGWAKDQTWGGDFLPHLSYLKNLTWRDLCAYRLIEPMSPHAASKLESIKINLSHLSLFWNSLDQFQDKILIIEGVGGICCPLGYQLTYLDFLKAHKAPCLLVSKIGLGSLNHAIMSEKILRDSGLEVLGLILNPEKDFDETDLVYQHAKWELEQQLSCPIIGPLSRNASESEIEPLTELICKIIP